MGKGNSTIRRGAGIVAITLGLLASTGSNAGAAGANLPDILNGHAEARALKIELSLPGAAELNAALQAAVADLASVTNIDIPAVDISNFPLEGLSLEQTISFVQGDVIRSTDELADNKSSGFAAVTIGDILNREVSSTCGGSCPNAAAAESERIDLPLSLGHIILNGAESSTPSSVESLNSTKLAQLLVDVRPLLNQLGVLGTLDGVLDTAFNDTLRELVNPALVQVNNTLQNTLPPNIRDQIVNRLVTIGQIEKLPSLETVDLLTLDVLGATANIRPETRGGVEGLLAESSSKIANVEVLGGWTQIEAINLSTEAYANAVKPASDNALAKANSTVLGANVGNGVALHASSDDVKFITDPVAVANVILADAGLEENETVKMALTDVANTTRLLLQVAGISVDIFGTHADWAKETGTWAEATAGSLAITFNPMIPKVSALLDSGNVPEGQNVPVLNDDDFIDTGIVLRVTFPEASSAVSVGIVKDSPPFKNPPRTGLGTPLLAGLMLLGGAMTVRRFALAR